MPRRASPHPTELELEVLNLLWERGSLSGGEVREGLAPRRDVTYQSVMTVLGIMEQKGFVRRKKVSGRFVYSARATRQTTAGRMLRDLVDRVFGGSTAAAAVNLLEQSELTPEELQQLEDLVHRKSQE